MELLFFCGVDLTEPCWGTTRITKRGCTAQHKILRTSTNEFTLTRSGAEVQVGLTWKITAQVCSYICESKMSPLWLKVQPKITKARLDPR